jgi:hypothetical protein
MSIISPIKPVARPTPRGTTIGPQAVFAAAALTTFAMMAGVAIALPGDFVLPAASTLLFLTAAAAALAGWLRERGPSPGRVTYSDVAGALTLIGIGAAVFMDADQLVRIFEAPHRAQ